MFWTLPRKAQVYVVAVVIAAALLSLYLLRFPSPIRVPTHEIIPLLLILGIASLVTELRVITTPAGDQRTIVSAMFIASILLLGATLTLPTIVVATVGSHLILRRPGVKAVFNVAQYILTTGVASGLYEATAIALGGGPAPGFNTLAGGCALVVLALSYFVINSGLVAAVIALSQGRPLLYVWNLANLEMLAQYAAMVVVGIIIAMLWETAPWSLVLVAVILVGVYVSFSLAESLQTTQRDLLRRMDELQRRTAELSLLNEITGALARAADPSHLWGVIYEQAGRVFDTRCFCILLRDEGSDAFRLAFGRLSGSPLTAPADEPEAPKTPRLARVREPVLVTGAEARAIVEELPVAATPEHIEAALAVPLTASERTVGMIVVAADQPEAYTEDDLRILGVIADQAAVAIEKARLQKEAAETRALHHLNILKAEFVSTVSHELRSPLTPIMGFAELLTMIDTNTETVREMAGEILRQAQHMQRLVDDLLDVSHMEAGRLRLELIEIDLDPLLRRTVREFSRQSDRHQIIYHRLSPLPRVRGDAVRLRQVLDNLLTNAIKYSPDGGRIDVRAWCTEQEIAISVADQGIGLPPDKIGRLFEKFYRVDNALAHRVRGSGLGLAIVKHIVDAHGGRIWVESEPGQGSTFTFTVPILPPDERQPSLLTSTGGAGRGMDATQAGEERSHAEAYSAG
ncbi:MAG: GAF domain-containing protein [Chloroflexi bacterium]|nr:GAF domain-containing protein [Chloroflexota bacterium]